MEVNELCGGCHGDVAPYKPSLNNFAAGYHCAHKLDALMTKPFESSFGFLQSIPMEFCGYSYPKIL